MAQAKKPLKPQAAGTRRLIAVGKRVGGTWRIRTSLWRYLASYLLHSQ